MVQNCEPDVDPGDSGMPFPHTHSAFLAASPQRGPWGWMQAEINPQPVASVCRGLELLIELKSCELRNGDNVMLGASLDLRNTWLK